MSNLICWLVVNDYGSFTYTDFDSMRLWVDFFESAGVRCEVHPQTTPLNETETVTRDPNKREGDICHNAGKKSG
jgi:hypothetical protein